MNETNKLTVSTGKDKLDKDRQKEFVKFLKKPDVSALGFGFV